MYSIQNKTIDFVQLVTLGLVGVSGQGLGWVGSGGIGSDRLSVALYGLQGSRWGASRVWAYRGSQGHREAHRGCRTGCIRSRVAVWSGSGRVGSWVALGGLLWVGGSLGLALAVWLSWGRSGCRGWGLVALGRGLVWDSGNGSKRVVSGWVLGRVAQGG